MSNGFLSEYFKGVAVKRLSAVESDLKRSHQHEINGVCGLKKLLGTGKQSFPAKFIYFCDNDADMVTAEGAVTWYDSRKAHPTRSEHRLYFQTTCVSKRFAKNDLLIVGRRTDETILVIVVESGSTVENQVLWLFGLSDPGRKFTIHEIKNKNDIELGFGVRYILEELGITIKEKDDQYLDTMLDKFKGKFPTTKVFSAFARETVPDASSIDDPDQVLLAWMEQEEKLFRILEGHLVSEILKKGFGEGDELVDRFFNFSLSVQNRRKARVGYALENNLEQVFKEHKLLYSRGAKTEREAKPDFIFPGISEYKNAHFPTERLSMLGLKTTCKDRWRQVLSEADKIKKKHLLTLEPGISENQTHQMQAHSLQLVIPTELHKTYRPAQQKWLWNLKDFIQMVRQKQS